jgi:hypothetical protein
MGLDEEWRQPLCPPILKDYVSATAVYSAISSAVGINRDVKDLSIYIDKRESQ